MRSAGGATYWFSEILFLIFVNLRKLNFMKKLVLLFVVLGVISCKNVEQKTLKQVDTSQNLKSKILDKEFGEKLLEADFLKFADKTKKDSLEIQLLNDFNIYDDNNYKYVFVDAEDLAKFSFDTFMPQINRMLEKRNIKIDVEVLKDYQKSNNILVNGTVLNLYTKQDLEDKSFWEKGTSNFFRKVNKILEKNKCAERIYLLYGGNDLGVILLDEKQFEIIKERYKNEVGEIPYLP